MSKVREVLSVLSIGVLEIYNDFFVNSNKYSYIKYHGQKDFRGLFKFFILVNLFFMMILGLKEGFANRLVDTFLNTVPGYGIPIWVRENLSSSVGTVGIDAKTMETLEKSYTVFPFWTVNLTGPGARMKLPGEGVWRRQPDDTSEMFSGRIVMVSDPYWINAHPDNDASIVLNRSILKPDGRPPRFNLASYRSALRARLPESMVRASLESLQTKDCSILDGADSNLEQCDVTKLSVLWLDSERILYNGSRIVEQYPLPIKWVDYIISAERIGFIISLPNYNRWRVLSKRPDTLYFSEFDQFYSDALDKVISASGIQINAAVGQNRARRLIFVNNEPVSSIDRLASKLNGSVRKHMDQMWTIEFDFPIPLWKVKAVGEEIGLGGFGWNTEAAGGIEFTSNGIYIACKGRYGENYEESKIRSQCENGNEVFNLKDQDGGYSDLIVYIKHRSEMIGSIKQVSSMTTLRLHESYSDSLMKASYLTSAIDLIFPAVGIVVTIIVIFMCVIKIEIIINQRRSNYGLMLSHGVSSGEIYGVVIGQVATLCVLSAMVSAILLYVCSYVSSLIMRRMVSDYLGKIAGAGHAFLEVNIGDILFTSGTLILIVSATTAYGLYRIGIVSKPRIAHILPK